jgi:hypothetical protein
MDERAGTISPTFYGQWLVGVPLVSVVLGLVIVYGAYEGAWAFRTVGLVLGCAALVLAPIHLVAMRRAKRFVDDSQQPEGWVRIVARMGRDALAASGAGALISLFF